MCAVLDDVFFSMADMDMSHSLSSLPPLGEPPTVDLDLSLNSNYSASPGESPSGNATVRLTRFQLLSSFIKRAEYFEWCPYVFRLCGKITWMGQDKKKSRQEKLLSSLEIRSSLKNY